MFRLTHYYQYMRDNRLRSVRRVWSSTNGNWSIRLRIFKLHLCDIYCLFVIFLKTSPFLNVLQMKRSQRLMRVSTESYAIRLQIFESILILLAMDARIFKLRLCDVIHDNGTKCLPLDDYTKRYFEQSDSSCMLQKFLQVANVPASCKKFQQVAKVPASCKHHWITVYNVLHLTLFCVLHQSNLFVITITFTNTNCIICFLNLVYTHYHVLSH